MNIESLISPEEAPLRRRRKSGSRKKTTGFEVDYWLLVPAVLLLCLGLVMVGSASVSTAQEKFGEPFFYLWRQAIYTVIGLLLAWFVLQTRISAWEKSGPMLLVLGCVSLLLVLLVGREVNGSTRWISFGIANFQPSELMKLFTVIFFAGYLARHAESLRTTAAGFVKPMIPLVIIGFLLILEPDFGAAVVITITVMAMLFLAGAHLRQFAALFLLAGGGLAIIASMSTYRVNRLTSFMDPWADPLGSGFQLIQSLIAFGRGELFGVGLGSSVQKMFYLPEAHTDFLFAVLSEELGLAGGISVIVLFTVFVFRAFLIGRAALYVERPFTAYLGFGLAMLIGLQAFINIGVNMGVLPTKGLTLPLMSYGGSSAVVTCISIAMLLRISHELKEVGALSSNKRGFGFGASGKTVSVKSKSRKGVQNKIVSGKLD